MPVFLQNFIDTISNYLPGVFSAIVVLIIGFFIAKLLKRLVIKLMSKTTIDEKISHKLGDSLRVDNFIGTLVYYLAMIYTLVVVLGMMGLTETLDPLKNMLNSFTGAIPSILTAGVIGFAGYMIATLVSEGVGALSGSLESYSSKMGVSSSINISKLLKQVVFLIIFIPLLIAAIDALGIEVISGPAKEMLGTLTSSIPMIITAAIILGVFYFVGTYVISILKELMRNVGMDDLAAKMGINSVLGTSSLSNVLGNLAFFFLMFTGVIAAFDKLGMGNVSEILESILAISGKIFFGLIILMAGSFIANIASKAVENGENKWMGPIVKFGVLGLFVAFALNTMGIAGQIVNLAFGLTLGAVAVAFALAFGLGGKEPASKLLDHYVDKVKKK